VSSRARSSGVIFRGIPPQKFDHLVELSVHPHQPLDHGGDELLVDRRLAAAAEHDPIVTPPPPRHKMSARD
jgi:hypothetical protein